MKKYEKKKHTSHKDGKLRTCCRQELSEQNSKSTPTIPQEQMDRTAWNRLFQSNRTHQNKWSTATFHSRQELTPRIYKRTAKQTNKQTPKLTLEKWTNKNKQKKQCPIVCICVYAYIHAFIHIYTYILISFLWHLIYDHFIWMSVFPEYFFVYLVCVCVLPTEAKRGYQIFQN